MDVQESSLMTPELLAELEEAAQRAAKGIRDREAMRQAAERMDRIAEENRRKFGVQNIGVDIIREFRGPLPE